MRLSPRRAGLAVLLVVAGFVLLSVFVHPLAATGLAGAALLLTIWTLHGRE